MSAPTSERRGLLIILSSPSGAGKSTLAKRLRAWDDSIGFSVSATTRPARPGEVDGVDYHFLSVETFQAKVTEGEMLEHAEVFGNFYGSPRAPVYEALDSGRDVVFDIDWQGGQQVRNSVRAEDVVSIFVLPPSIAELHRRLNSRAQDSAETIARRMSRSRDEISHWAEYDYILVNEDIDRAETELQAIVTAERLRRSRQPGLIHRVRALNEEFEATT
ncbi:MAG: guanylate kinase [Pseudomonadota bacterium]